MKCDLCGEREATTKLVGGYYRVGLPSGDRAVIPSFTVPTVRRQMRGCGPCAAAWDKQHGRFVSAGNEFTVWVRELAQNNVKVTWKRVEA